MKDISLVLIVTTLMSGMVHGFENYCNDNLAVYWGQNSYGAANVNDRSKWQQSLRQYCQDSIIDIIPMAFVTQFFGTGDLPVINLANICNNVDNSTFPGTSLADCSHISNDIQFCQSKGKAVTLSLGGATGGAGFQSESQASSFADTIWNLFLGGFSSTRPFGDAVLDGVDLDIEGGGSKYYDTFLTRLRSHFNDAEKKYYITAAPQCVYPDGNLGATISENYIDAIYVQFYNNPCGLQTWGKTGWNYGIWDYWAKNNSPNKDIKIYIGAPASPSAAGGGYVPLDTLLSIALTTRKSYPSFGGVMFWDASQAVGNGDIGTGIKQALSDSGSCSKSFEYPACDTPAYSPDGRYTGGSKVSHDGYIWQAMWYASGPPDGTFRDWIPISACAGETSESAPTPSSSSSSKGSPIRSSPTMSPSTGPSTTPPPNTISCGEVSVWSSTTVYKSGDQAAYNSQIYKAKWWTLGDIPGSSIGVWVVVDSCSSQSKVIPIVTSPNDKGSAFATRINPSCKDATQWQLNTQYTEGSKVTHGGHIYIATWWNENEEPATENVVSWKLDVVCNSAIVKRENKIIYSRACKNKWLADEYYFEQNLVSQGGKLYMAKFRSKGQSPERDTSTWSLVSTCA